jgi:hypothetical protein
MVLAWGADLSRQDAKSPCADFFGAFTVLYEVCHKKNFFCASCGLKKTF